MSVQRADELENIAVAARDRIDRLAARLRDDPTVPTSEAVREVGLIGNCIEADLTNWVARLRVEREGLLG